MKKITLFATGIALVSAVAFTAPAVAADGKTVIGVVDMQELQESSVAYKDLMKQRDKILADIKAEATKDEAKLRELEQSITKERAVLTQEELAKKTEDFRGKVMEFQQKYKDKEEELYKAVMEANVEIQDKAFSPAIKEVVEAKGLDIVVGTAQLAYFKPDMEITEDVGKIMNEKLPSVTLKLKEGKKEGKKK